MSTVWGGMVNTVGWGSSIRNCAGGLGAGWSPEELKVSILFKTTQHTNKERMFDLKL